MIGYLCFIQIYSSTENVLNTSVEFPFLLVYQWASVLSWVALEQERMLPVVLDLLQTQSDQEMRSLTGLLRNLSRHSRNKDDMGETQPPVPHTVHFYLCLSCPQPCIHPFHAY